MGNKNIILKNTLKQYNKKYRHNKSLLKFTKKEVEEFDKQANTKGENYLLRNNKWWLIGDTYYQVPKTLHHYWFRNLNAGVQTAICLLGAGIVATGATLPFVIKNVKKDDGDDVFIDPAKENDAKIEVLSKSSLGVVYKVSPKDSTKKKVTGIESVCIGNDTLVKDSEYTYKACNTNENDSIELTINQAAFSSHSGPIRVLPIVEDKEEPQIEEIKVTDMDEKPIEEIVVGEEEKYIKVIGIVAESNTTTNLSNKVSISESSYCTISKKDDCLEIKRDSKGEETITFTYKGFNAELKIKDKDPETKTIPVTYDVTAIGNAGFILSEQEEEIKTGESVSFKLTNNTEIEHTFDIVAYVNGNEVYKSEESKILLDGETQSYSIDASSIQGFELLTEEDEIVISVELKTTSIHTDLETANLFLKPNEEKYVKILDNNNQNLSFYCKADGYSSEHLDAQIKEVDGEYVYAITAYDSVKGSDNDTITFSYNEEDSIECSINVTYAKTLQLNSVSLPTGITQTGTLVDKVIQTGDNIDIALNSTLDEYIAGITIKDTSDNIVFEDYLTIANGESTISLNNGNIEWKKAKEDATYTIYINGKDVSSIRPSCGNKLVLHANDAFSLQILDQNGTNVSADCNVSYDPEGDKKLTVTKTGTQFDITVADSYTTDDYTHLYFTYGDAQIRTSIYIEFMPRTLNVKFDNILHNVLKTHNYKIDTDTSTSSIVENVDGTEIKIKYSRLAGGLLADISLRLYIKDKDGNVLKNCGVVNFYMSNKPVTLKFAATDFSNTSHDQYIYIHGEEL